MEGLVKETLQSVQWNSYTVQYNLMGLDAYSMIVVME
jgi:hypothetical protein